jgi:hypothetical protein
MLTVGDRFRPFFDAPIAVKVSTHTARAEQSGITFRVTPATRVDLVVVKCESCGASFRALGPNETGDQPVALDERSGLKVCGLCFDETCGAPCEEEIFARAFDS